MHEHHQVQGLIDQAIDLAKQQKLSKINKLTVVMGDGLGFDEGSVRLYFETLGEGTILEGAEIELKHIPVKLHCQHCQKDYLKQPKTLDCPDCGKQGVPTAVGK